MSEKSPITEVRYKIRMEIPKDDPAEKSFNYEEWELSAQVDADEDVMEVMKHCRSKAISGTHYYRKHKKVT